MITDRLYAMTAIACALVVALAFMLAR